ncbi:MAG: hypothetical protein KatS3mg082_1846 [Nitrospiraceae bacterium]|nr:MAG: hypothetical protein KatS3mg082_1846 [Nitrospiraceae bacterium]
MRAIFQCFAVALVLHCPVAWGQAPKGWVVHKDPMGFSVQLPRGWTVSADRSSGRVELQGLEGEQVIVGPVFIPASLERAAAPSVLHRLATKLRPGAQWEPPQPAGAAAVRMRGHVGDRLAVAVFTWVTSPKGSAGYVYTMAAPEARYRQLEQTFAKILQSFRVSGAAAKEAAPSLSYVRWQDPRENAFSVDVPSQWTMSGGLFRVASVDVRPAWEALSPDGQIRITGGDAEIPPFTLPTPTLEMTGFHEGSWYSPGYGVTMMVRRYIPGTAFATEYVTTKVARGCSQLTFTETRDRPDAVQAINAVYAQYGNVGMSVSLTAGEAAFICRRDDQLMQGYYFAGTQLTASAGMGGVWNVQYLFGYLAAREKAEQAQSVLNTMIKSLQLDPQWVAMQQNVTANVSQIVSRTNAEISSIISESYWSRQGTMDELSRRRSNAILGVEDVMDPVTGREIKVESGSSYYWIDQRGTIVGTETDTRPNIDFRELIRLP